MLSKVSECFTNMNKVISMTHLTAMVVLLSLFPLTSIQVCMYVPGQYIATEYTESVPTQCRCRAKNVARELPFGA